MSFQIIKNRIPELIKGLKAVKNSKKKYDAYRPVAETTVNVLAVEMRRRAPVGRLEPNYSIQTKARFQTISHGRPSIRQHGTTLADGWELPVVARRGGGVGFSVGSHAPHMAILLTGARAHRIPKGGNSLISFYWFEHYEKFKAAIFAHVNHPGFARKTFIEESAASKRPFVLAKFREGTARVLSPLRQFFE